MGKGKPFLCMALTWGCALSILWTCNKNSKTTVLFIWLFGGWWPVISHRYPCGLERLLGCGIKWHRQKPPSLHPPFPPIPPLSPFCLFPFFLSCRTPFSLFLFPVFFSFSSLISTLFPPPPSFSFLSYCLHFFLASHLLTRKRRRRFRPLPLLHVPQSGMVTWDQHVLDIANLVITHVSSWCLFSELSILVFGKEVWLCCQFWTRMPLWWMATGRGWKSLWERLSCSSRAMASAKLRFP